MILIIVLIILLCIILSLSIYLIITPNQYTQAFTLSGGKKKDMLLLSITMKTPSKGKSYKEAEDEILWLDREWNKNKTLRQTFSKEIVPKLHPFKNMRSEIESSLVGKVPITNAFIKCAEFIHRFNIRYSSLYDIASAPGMFIIAAQYINKKPIEWHACSFFSKSYLGDTYGLYKKYPKNITNLNLLDYESCDKIISTEDKYDLVTGDVGYIHGYGVLQETSHINLEYSQARLAVNLVKEGGNIFLKMYSCISNNNIWLLNQLYNYFDELYLWKPYSSRITNDETYIVGIHRNSSKVELPSNPPTIEDTPNNASLYYTFYYELAHLKNELVRGNEKLITKWIKDMEPTIKYIQNLVSN